MSRPRQAKPACRETTKPSAGREGVWRANPRAAQCAATRIDKRPDARPDASAGAGTGAGIDVGPVVGPERGTAKGAQATTRIPVATATTARCEGRGGAFGRRGARRAWPGGATQRGEGEGGHGLRAEADFVPRAAAAHRKQGHGLGQERARQPGHPPGPEAQALYRLRRATGVFRMAFDRASGLLARRRDA